MIPRFTGTSELMNTDRWRVVCLLLVVAFALSACAMPADTPTEVPMPPTPTPLPWTDASAVMNGLCFESVADAAEQLFVIRSAEELTRFYDLADESELCRHPVQRGDFDFSGGRILAGTWSRAIGCTARHEIVSVQRDDTAQTLAITLRLLVDADCNYELVRPFWIALDGVADYDIRVTVQ